MSNRWYKDFAAAGVVLGLIIAGPVLAAWSDDPTARTPICTAEYQQYFPQLVAVDGGFITTWNDQRRGSYQDVYAQNFPFLERCSGLRTVG
jgi:predicted ribosomally synthesized peptide with SipW-like signal peptide